MKSYFNDYQYKTQLEARIATGSFYISWAEGGGEPSAGLVSKVIYAGYRVKMPDGSEVTVNPDKTACNDEITTEEYESIAAAWRVRVDFVSDSQPIRDSLQSSTIDERIWFNDENYKSQLDLRVATGEFFTSWEDCEGTASGLVTKIIYAGYKVKLPGGSEIIVNPNKTAYQSASNDEVTKEEYESIAAAWIIRNDEKQRVRLELEREKSEREAQRLAKQMACKHEIKDLKDEKVGGAAGCDIYEVSCLACCKVLKRSWATAYDKDPDDHVVGIASHRIAHRIALHCIIA
jgi:hypothetical protein